MCYQIYQFLLNQVSSCSVPLYILLLIYLSLCCFTLVFYILVVVNSMKNSHERMLQSFLT